MSITPDDSPQYIFKLILIGDSNTGKTSLINRYVHNTFDKKHMCTIGVDFMMKRLIVNNQPIKLQIWDTAGLERYKQITSSYYRGANGAVVVFDLSCLSSFISVQRWINEFCEIANLSSKARRMIVLVGNKSDLVNEREVLQSDIDKLIKVNDIAYFETSAKDGNNVNIVFEAFTTEMIKNFTNNIDSAPPVLDQSKFKIDNGQNINTFNNLMRNEEKSKRYCC